ncbi:MAG: hypothetical protein ACK4SF_00685 [Algoriphagus aquaeductus]|uniref:Uncharacterized protein n=1 Tax=Algoriphagus aquaeductus TaxID=475299 RepID=A0A326RXE6_9BACT|nr:MULTISPECIES: hypothetical protein [Algoriphagus]PZV86302.1 hypothetical protein CLV31_102202 [Algoriphagus aquaeductus]
MPARDPVLTPELIKILKIFIFSSLGLVLVFSFFNSYRADNTGQNRTFRVADADRLYFLNVRGLSYDRELRKDAGMTLFRHGKRKVEEENPTFFPLIIHNPIKDEAYVYFELLNSDYPVKIFAKSTDIIDSVEFSNGNNQDHLDLVYKIKPWIEASYEFELAISGKRFPLWSDEKEKDVLKTVMEDYFRLLNQSDN